MDCPYCGAGADLVTGEVVYEKNSNYSKVLIYVCRNYPECDTYVGAHEKTLWPKGTLANRELRYWRKQAHKTFDKLWQSGRLQRGTAYGLLAIKLGIERKESHIGSFDLEQCKKVVEIFSNISDEDLSATKLPKPILAKK